jgi:hypothetical protein
MDRRLRLLFGDKLPRPENKHPQRTYYVGVDMYYGTYNYCLGYSEGDRLYIQQFKQGTANNVRDFDDVMQEVVRRYAVESMALSATEMWSQVLTDRGYPVVIAGRGRRSRNAIVARIFQSMMEDEVRLAHESLGDSRTREVWSHIQTENAVPNTTQVRNDFEALLCLHDMWWRGKEQACPTGATALRTAITTD